MKHVFFAASILGLSALGQAGHAQEPQADLPTDLCSANAQTLADLSTQHSTMICTYESLPIDAAQAEVDRLNGEVEASEAVRSATQTKLNEASDRTVKLDTKISSLIDDTNVSTDDSILILGVENYDSIKELQTEREALMNETLALQSELSKLETAHAALEDELVLAKANLAAAQAAEVVFKQSEGGLRSALTQANYIAINICGQTPVEIMTTCNGEGDTAEDAAEAATPAE